MKIRNKLFSSLFVLVLCVTLSFGFVACSDGAPSGGDAADIVSITVENAKTEFLTGEKFTSSGISVNAVLSDGSERVLLEDEYLVDATGFRSDIPRECTISVKARAAEASTRYNVNVVRGKASFKILAIGNSFSEDSLAHLYAIAEEMGAENIVLGNMYIGGCSLARHADNMQRNLNAYQYQKNTDGTWVKNDGKSILYALEDEEWDIISLQQASGGSGKVETYNKDMTNILQYLFVHKPKPETNIVWNMTWAYQSDSTHADFPAYDNNQMTMYEGIVNAVREKVVGNKIVQIIIPAGTAIQNLRTSYLGDTLTRDGYHLSYGLGRYAAGLTWLAALTGWDISDMRLGYSGLSEKEIRTVKECVLMATANPFEVTQSKIID